MTKLFELVEKALYDMAFFVMMVVTVPRLHGIGFGRNTVSPATCFNIVAYFRCSVSFVAHNNTVRNGYTGQHFNSNGTITDIPGGEI